MLVLIDAQNIEVYCNLAHAYEAEFSGLTKKMPNEAGLFEIDTLPTFPYSGYLLYHEMKPIGFCVFKIDSTFNDIAEFYITPGMRKNGHGAKLAFSIFDKYPGTWHIRQIAGADNASAFWRKVVAQYTAGQFFEEKISDPDWGIVTLQTFTTSKKSTSLLQSLRLNSIFSPEKQETTVMTPLISQCVLL